MKNNNSGLSLVELVVTMAVLAVASTAIMAFLNSGIRNYQRGKEEADIQYEAQLATNQIVELLIDANKGISYSMDSWSPWDDSLYSNSDVPDKENKFFAIYNSDEYYLLTWNQTDRTISYTEYQKENPGDRYPTKTTSSNELLADSVKEMAIDLQNADTNGRVRLTFTFQKAENGKEYTVNQYVTVRNAINNEDFLVNQTIDKVYVDAP